MIPRDHDLAGRVLGLIPVNSLDERLQGEVLEKGELVEFKRRKVVFEAGDRDPYTLYLVDGELEMESDVGAPIQLTGGQDNANRALAQLQPRRYTAKAVSNAVLFRIERAVLDRILSDEQMLGDGGSVQVDELEEDEEDGDWMTRLLTSELFTRMPHDNIQKFFAELEPVPGEAGDVLVEQGTSGDYLYIVAEGQCAVTRRPPGGGDEVQLAVLKEGDTFGEESLISNSPRNASVKMLTDGFVMRLAKRSFEELVSKPTLKALPYSEACSVVEGGGAWLDVRFADEHEALAIEGSVNVPLNTLRSAAGDLDRSRHYVVYCDTGARSSSGAFLLTRLGFDASYLAGGLERTPLGDDQGASAPAAAAEPEEDGDDAGFEMVSGAAAEAEPAEEAPAPAEETPAPAPRADAESAAAAAAAAEKVARLEAAQAALKTERDQAVAKLKNGAEAFQELKRRFEEIRAAGKAEQDRRKAVEAELATIKAEAGRQVGMEKARLEGELEKATARIAELQGQAKSAVERVESERARLASELEEARRSAESLRAEHAGAEQARVAAEVAAQELVQSAKDDLQRATARAEQAEKSLESLRGELSAAQASTDEVRQNAQDQRSAVDEAVKEAEGKLREENERLEAERARLEGELASIASGQQETEARLREERKAVDEGAAALEARTAELDRREMDLTQARGDVESTLAQREESVTRAEAALAEEKANWQAQVEKAIAEERERLATSYAEREQDAARAAEEQAKELAEQEVAEVRAEMEALEVALRAEAAAGESKLRAEMEAQMESQVQAARQGDATAMQIRLEKKLAQMEREYKTKLLDQEAVLEDERRRLELEGVRLREALDEAQRIIKDVEAVHAGPGRGAPAPAAEEPELVLELDEDDAAPPPPPKAAAKPAPAPASDVPELMLDLDEEDAAPPPPPPKAKPAPEPGVPVIEFPDDDDEPETAEAEETDKDAAPRVLDPKQIAAIRKKMEEKMRAKRA